MAGPTLVFDLETQRLADEVGGWTHIHRMRLACAVALDLETGEFRDYLEPDASRLAADLQSAGLVVGFNVKRFDYIVLQPYTDVRLAALPTLDLLEQVEHRLGSASG
jgi:DEAD/DEAH box helicase domain-containing protein